MYKIQTEPKFWSHVILEAGLGNQLFMLANGYAYSLKNKTKLTVSKTWGNISKERPSYWDNLLYKWKDMISHNIIILKVNAKH